MPLVLLVPFKLTIMREEVQNAACQGPHPGVVPSGSCPQVLLSCMRCGIDHPVSRVYGVEPPFHACMHVGRPVLEAQTQHLSLALPCGCCCRAHQQSSRQHWGAGEHSTVHNSPPLEVMHHLPVTLLHPRRQLHRRLRILAHSLQCQQQHIHTHTLMDHMRRLCGALCAQASPDGPQQNRTCLLCSRVVVLKDRGVWNEPEATVVLLLQETPKSWGHAPGYLAATPLHATTGHARA